MSAHPLLHSKQLQKQKIKMAMALIGKNKHYHWSQIQRRHFISTAEAVHFSTQKAEDHLHAMLSQVEAVIQAVSKQLPPDFPTHISESIFSGMLDAKASY